MAKKHFGKLIAFAAIAGAAAAGISYILQYRSFHEELNEEFHDFEDDFDEFEDTKEQGGATGRNYVSLSPEKQAAKAQGDADRTDADICKDADAPAPSGEKTSDDKASIKKEEDFPSSQPENTPDPVQPAPVISTTTIVEDVTD